LNGGDSSWQECEPIYSDGSAEGDEDEEDGEEDEDDEDNDDDDG
jgi:hypothetical protein